MCVMDTCKIHVLWKLMYIIHTFLLSLGSSISCCATTRRANGFMIRLADSDTVMSAQFQTRLVTGVAMAAVIDTSYLIILAGVIMLCAKIERIHKFTHFFFTLFAVLCRAVIKRQEAGIFTGYYECGPWLLS